MSAYMVDTAHIDALLTAGLDRYGAGPLRWWLDDEPRSMENRRELTYETAGQVGAMLLAENRKSVNYRYEEDDWEEPYEFHKLPGYYPHDHALAVLKAIRGYGYQACETPGYPRSEARAFCVALAEFLVTQVPGYAEATTWSISSADAFSR